jgi:hypothetical protein
MDTTIVAQCKHGESCIRTICRVLAAMEAECAAGAERVASIQNKPVSVQDRNWDATFPPHMRRRHILQRGRY